MAGPTDPEKKSSSAKPSGWVPVSAEQLQKSGKKVAQRPAAPPSETAMRRAALAHKMQGLGAPLAQQVRQHGRSQAGLKSTALAPLVGLGAAAPTLLLGMVLPLAPVALIAASVFGLGFVLTRQRQNRQLGQSLADEIDLAAQYDAFLLQHGARLPQAALDSLQQIKTRLVPLLARLPEIRQRALLNHEDAFFIAQTVQRYVPDAVTPILTIPAEKHMLIITEDGKSAAQLLQEQLQIVLTKLDKLQQQLLAQDAQKLAQHKRFLEKKTLD